MKTKKNSLHNEKLGKLWDFLYNIYNSTQRPEYAEFSFDMSEYQKAIQETDRICSDPSIPLKIIVAGRMKAGKSMMTDMLYFDGKGVLNSDTTPATANIMYIRCADETHKPGAEITFLTQDEIEEMKIYLSNQKESGEEKDGSLTDQVRYEAVKERLEKIDHVFVKVPEIKKLIGKTKIVSREEVKEYSDGNGKFSDLVNQIDLYIDEPDLKNITVVDTPGMGDPVVSRGQKARDESRTAEVVFYLSCANHFMDMEDVEEYVLLKRVGCRNIVLVMSRFDEVFDPEEEEEMESFTDSMVYCRLAYEGTQRIKKAMEQYGMTYEIPVIIPICALGAKLSGGQLDNDDPYYRDSLKEIFPEWDGETTLYQGFGLDEIRGELDRIRTQKEKIREQSNAEKIAGCQTQVFREYETLKARVESSVKFDEQRLLAPITDESEKVGPFGSDMEKNIENVLGKLKLGCIIKECEKIEEEINKYSRSAKALIDTAGGPASIHNAYEINFKNAVEDMFIGGESSGIRSRLRFEKGDQNYGGLLEYFADAIKHALMLHGLDSDLVNAWILKPLCQDFGTELLNKFEPAISGLMPVNNINEVLGDACKELREKASVYKENRTFGKSKNLKAKGDCKEIIDIAANKINAMLEKFKSNVNTMFGDAEDADSILAGLINKLSDRLGTLREKLEYSDKKVIENDIGNNRLLLETLEGLLKEELQNDYLEWKKSEV